MGSQNPKYIAYIKPTVKEVKSSRSEVIKSNANESLIDLLHFVQVQKTSKLKIITYYNPEENVDVDIHTYLKNIELKDTSDPFTRYQIQSVFKQFRKPRKDILIRQSLIPLLQKSIDSVQSWNGRPQKKQKKRDPSIRVVSRS